MFTMTSFAALAICILLLSGLGNIMAQTEAPGPQLLQVCNGSTPVTCLFHQWEHAVGPRGYCAATPADCQVLMCGIHAPYLCQSYGRCVSDIATCYPCTEPTPFRCQYDWSCQANEAACPTAPTNPAGALVKVTYSGITGVLLDEVSSTSGIRDRAFEYYSSLPSSFWTAKALYQGRMMEYKQVFRAFYYHNLQQLTTPPENLWNFAIVGSPYRARFNGHDHVAVNYTFESYVLGTESTLINAEPRLVIIGGSFVGKWQMPIDESQLLQRTGYACMDELDFPLNGVDSENTYVYYDDTCTFETPANQSCHWSNYPTANCIDALTTIGTQAIHIKWERVAWDDNIAAQYRWPSIDSLSEDPSMIPAKDGILDNRIYWRYFKNDSCEVLRSENYCVKAPGWRKLLTFQSASVNNGKRDLILGVPTFWPWTETNLFQFSTCHNHYHFSHYVSFNYSGPAVNAAGRKAAFCVQSTWRYYNTEFTPFACDFGSCIYQGIASGWGDSYNTGLSCQWLDVTGVAASTNTLHTVDNPENIICEGTLVVDNTTGNYILVPTGTFNIDGLPQYEPECHSTASINETAKQANTQVTIPANGGTIVTSTCSNHQFGPKRNCGFSFIRQQVACTPNATLNIRILPSPISTAVRFCPFSIIQNVAIPCEYNYAYANAVVDDKPVLVTFTCPVAIDDAETGGFYSIFGAPSLESDPFLAPTLQGLHK